MGSIFTDRNLLSDRPGSPSVGSPPTCQLHPLRSVVPSVESVRAEPGCPDTTAVTLLGFCPSSDQTFQASDPRTRPPRKGRTPTFTRRLQSTAPGSGTPQNRVRPNQHPKELGRPRRQSPALFRTGPRHLSVTSPSPLTFQPAASHRPRPSELLSARNAESPPKRSPGHS
jgi:hypothetical protein